MGGENTTMLEGTATFGILLENTTTLEGNATSATFGKVVSFFVGCAMLVTILTGILGNCTSIAIYTHRFMRSPINVLLAALAVADLLLVVCCLPVFALPALNSHLDIKSINAISTWSLYLFYGVILTIQTTSNWLLVLITVERFMAVCYPLKTMVHRTIGRVTCGLVVVIALAAIYNIPRYFEFVIIAGLDKKTGENISFVDQSDLRNDDNYYNYYTTTLYLITHFAVPFTVLLVLNSYVVCTIRRARSLRQSLSRSQDKEHRTAVMMVVVIVIFALTNTSPFVINIAEAMDRNLFVPGSSSIGDEFAYAWLDISNLLVSVNSASTFFVYMVFSQRYRDMFRVLVLRNKSKYSSLPQTSKASAVNHSVAINKARRSTRELDECRKSFLSVSPSNKSKGLRSLESSSEVCLSPTVGTPEERQTPMVILNARNAVSAEREHSSDYLTPEYV